MSAHTSHRGGISKPQRRAIRDLTTAPSRALPVAFFWESVLESLAVRGWVQVEGQTVTATEAGIARARKHR